MGERKRKKGRVVRRKNWEKKCESFCQEMILQVARIVTHLFLVCLIVCPSVCAFIIQPHHASATVLTALLISLKRALRNGSDVFPR